MHMHETCSLCHLLLHIFLELKVYECFERGKVHLRERAQQLSSRMRARTPCHRRILPYLLIFLRKPTSNNLRIKVISCEIRWRICLQSF